MRFDCGPTWQEREAAKKAWHRWFAWHPVRIGDSHDCRWLETVERKGELHSCGSFGGDWWTWEYRTP